MYKENNKGPRTVPLGTHDKTGAQSDFTPFTTRYYLKQRKVYPLQWLATDSIAKQFAFKELMRGCIKCLFKIQYECVNLSPTVQDFSPVIYYHSQLSSRGARWLSGRVSDSGARGPGFETYRRRVVSLSKTLYSPKVLVNYPGSDGSVPI